MTDREKLIEILKVPIYPHEQADQAEVVADYLLDNGVTVQQWIPVKDGLPSKEDADRKGNVQVVFNGYVTTWKWDLISRVREITHWMPLPEPPKEC